MTNRGIRQNVDAEIYGSGAKRFRHGRKSTVAGDQFQPVPWKRLALSARPHEATGACAGIFTIFEDGRPGNQGSAIPIDALYEAAATGGQVMDDFGLVQVQPVEVDYVDVST